MPSREEWNKKFELAKKFMEDRSGIRKALIEVAAQHPLIDGTKPGIEFSARLLRGKELWANLKIENETEIYITGSRHVDKVIEDEIPLSQAGVNFLIEQEVPSNVLHGRDLNYRYKKKTPLVGVYGSADECYVTASYFRDGNFGLLTVICSPFQALRKQLHYNWFGVNPRIETVTVPNMYHSPVTEAVHWIPYIFNEDPSLKGEDSKMGIQLRHERMPKNFSIIYDI